MTRHIGCFMTHDNFLSPQPRKGHSLPERAFPPATGEFFNAYRPKMKDYRLTVKVRNNRILKAIEAAGGTPGKKWCDNNGLDYNHVNDFINMTSGPLTREKLSTQAEKLCYVLGKLPEELWSKEQIYPLERNFSEMELDHSQILSLLPVDEQSYLPDFSNIENEETNKLLSVALSYLSKKEQEVIRLRFTENLTLTETAKRFSLSNERIRQIECRAIRKLRSPKILNTLAGCLE